MKRKFIEIVNTKGYAHFLNVDHITAVYNLGSGTVIITNTPDKDSDNFYVTTTWSVDQVMKLIDQD